MPFNLLNRRRIRQALTVIFVSAATLFIAVPNHPVFRDWHIEPLHISLIFLVLGLFFLFINQTRLMFVCFGCSGVISFYVNETEIKKAKLPQDSGIWHQYEPKKENLDSISIIGREY
jgi:hypothetical protein